MKFKQFRRHPQDGWPMPLRLQPHDQCFRMRWYRYAIPLTECEHYEYPRRRKNMTWVQWKRWAMDRCYNNNTPKQQRDWKWFQANVPASHREGVYELEDDGDWYRGAYVVVEGEVTTLDSHRVCTRCKKWRLVWRYKPETFCFLGYWCIDCRKEDEGMEVRW